MKRYLLKIKSIPRLSIILISQIWHRFFPMDCYEGIDDLCIFYWDKIHETGNHSYLIKSNTTHINRKRPTLFREVFLSARWRRIEEEHVAKFGFTENFLRIIRKEKEILKMREHRMRFDDRSLNAFIKIAEDELEYMKANDKGVSFYDTKLYIEKFVGIRFDPMNTSVSEFYSYIKKVSQSVAQKKAQ